MDDIPSVDPAAAAPGPLGRERVVALLVQAARKLFAERGPDAVPLRAVAKEAGVNYGLIYQYVGTKDDLLRLVFQSASSSYAEEFGRSQSANEAIEFLMRPRSQEYVRMLAHSLLEGRDPATLLDRSPALAELSERIGEAVPRSGDPALHDPRVVAAIVTTMSLGWGLFGEFAMTIAGITDIPKDELREVVIGIAERLAVGDDQSRAEPPGSAPMPGEA